MVPQKFFGKKKEANVAMVTEPFPFALRFCLSEERGIFIPTICVMLCGGYSSPLKHLNRFLNQNILDLCIY